MKRKHTIQDSWLYRHRYPIAGVVLALIAAFMVSYRFWDVPTGLSAKCQAAWSERYVTEAACCAADAHVGCTTNFPDSSIDSTQHGDDDGAVAGIVVVHDNYCPLRHTGSHGHSIADIAADMRLLCFVGNWCTSSDMRLLCFVGNWCTSSSCRSGVNCHIWSNVLYVRWSVYSTDVTVGRCVASADSPDH